MTALSPRVSTKTVLKHQIKISPRSNFPISPITSLIPSLQNLNDYSLASPRLTTLESERSQYSTRKKPAVVPLLKSNLLGGTFSSGSQTTRPGSTVGNQGKEKRDILKDFSQRRALLVSNGPSSELVRSYSTIVTPRKGGEVKGGKEGDSRGHKTQKEDDFTGEKERFLMALIRKGAEAHDLKQGNQQSSRRAQEPSAVRQEEEKTIQDRRVSQGYNTERNGQNRASLQAVTLETEGDRYEDKKKRVFKKALKGGLAQAHGMSQLPLGDMSLDSRTLLGTTTPGGNWSSYSKLYTKANSRVSPSDFIQQLSVRSHRGESTMKTARIQTLKSIYDSQPDSRKSSKKFRLKRRPNNSLNRLVLAEGPDSPKEVKTERAKILKQSFVKGNVHKTVTTEADSKMSNFSVESTGVECGKKEKNNMFGDELAYLLSRFKKLLNCQSEQRNQLKEKTLMVMAKISEIENKGPVVKKEGESSS